MSYVPDDLSLMFLYALGDTDISQRLNNTFELTCRDPEKIHLSHLIKYANFHWRQWPGHARTA